MHKNCKWRRSTSIHFFLLWYIRVPHPRFPWRSVSGCKNLSWWVVLFTIPALFWYNQDFGTPSLLSGTAFNRFVNPFSRHVHPRCHNAVLTVWIRSGLRMSTTFIVTWWWLYLSFDNPLSHWRLKPFQPFIDCQQANDVVRFMVVNNWPIHRMSERDYTMQRVANRWGEILLIVTIILTWGPPCSLPDIRAFNTLAFPSFH